MYKYCVVHEHERAKAEIQLVRRFSLILAFSLIVPLLIFANITVSITVKMTYCCILTSLTLT